MNVVHDKNAFPQVGALNREVNLTIQIGCKAPVFGAGFVNFEVRHKPTQLTRPMQ